MGIETGESSFERFDETPEPPGFHPRYTPRERPWDSNGGNSEITPPSDKHRALTDRSNVDALPSFPVPASRRGSNSRSSEITPPSDKRRALTDRSNVDAQPKFTSFVESDSYSLSDAKMPERSDGGFFDELAGKAFEAGLWKAVEIVADMQFPGSGQLIVKSFRAVKIISAVHGTLVGAGFIFQVGLAGIPGTGLCLAFRIREGADGNPWPNITIGLDINVLEQLETGKPDVDGRAQHQLEPKPPPVPPWPGDWTIVLGMRGIRDHEAILDTRGMLNDLSILDERRAPTNVRRWIPFRNQFGNPFGT